MRRRRPRKRRLGFGDPSLVTLRDLQYLVALADHLSFRRAADMCFVSQPTLSAQIRKLEDELGIKLLERTSRSVLLTRAGQETVARARVILRDVNELKSAAGRLREPEGGTIRLGIFPTLGPYLLPHAVPLLRQRFPKVELQLVEEKSGILTARLRDGRLDAIFSALPAEDHRFHVEPLFDEAFLLAVPSGHALAGRESLSLDDIRAQELMLLEDGHCLRDQTLDLCRLAGAGEASGFRATSLETLRQMVAANGGITLLPELAARPPAFEMANIRLLPFTDPPPSRSVALLWRRTSAIASLLTEVAAIFRQVPDIALANRATRPA
ncbi:LysR substrate-binding domain-containing protein [Rhizobium sp.]